MSNEIKAVRKVARCIRTLLENEGVKITASKITDLIKDKDLTDINLLKNEVANDMRATPTNTPKAEVSSRKQRIETFMISNWASIKDSPEIKDALINAYCQGRITKEKRTEMKDALLSKCEPSQPQQVNVEEMEDDITTELAGALLGEEPKVEPNTNKKYDF